MAMKLTDRMERMLKLAHGYSRKWNHEFLAVEHVLLAMLDDANCVATFAIRSLCDLAKFRIALCESMTQGEPMVTIGNLPKTPRLKGCLAAAERFAARCGHQFIGSEHLIVGIMAEGQSSAAILLRQHGVDDDSLVAKVEEVLQLPGSEASRATTATLVASLNRTAEVLQVLQSDGDADLRLALNGVFEAIRWLGEYRNRTAK